MTQTTTDLNPVQAWLDRAVRAKAPAGLWVALCALVFGGFGLLAGPLVAILGLLFGAVVGLLLGAVIEVLVKAPLAILYCALRIFGWARSKI